MEGLNDCIYIDQDVLPEADLFDRDNLICKGSDEGILWVFFILFQEKRDRMITLQKWEVFVLRDDCGVLLPFEDAYVKDFGEKKTISFKIFLLILSLLGVEFFQNRYFLQFPLENTF